MGVDADLLVPTLCSQQNCKAEAPSFLLMVPSLAPGSSGAVTCTEFLDEIAHHGGSVAATAKLKELELRLVDVVCEIEASTRRVRFPEAVMLLASDEGLA